MNTEWAVYYVMKGHRQMPAVRRCRKRETAVREARSRYSNLNGRLADDVVVWHTPSSSMSFSAWRDADSEGFEKAMEFSMDEVKDMIAQLKGKTL